MGHKRLGYLPKTKRWREIVEQIGSFVAGSTDVSSIANKTLQTVQERFENLSNDPSIQSSFEFLVQFSYAFQKENPTKYLTENKQEFEFSKDNIVIIKTKEKLVPKIIFGISSEGIWMTDIEIQKPTLEDVFLQISRSK